MYVRKIAIIGMGAMLASAAAIAQAQSYSATVVDSDCEVVATTTSAAGAIGGSAVGGVAGSVLGDALFGRTGRILGGIIGSGGGAVAGERMLEKKTYRCVVTAEVQGVGKIYLETLGAPRNIGQSIVVVKTSNGQYIAK